MKKLLLTFAVLFTFSVQIKAQVCQGNLVTNSTFTPALASWSQYGTVSSTTVIPGTSGCLNNYYILQTTNNSNTGISQLITFKKDSCYNLCYCYEVPNSGSLFNTKIIFAAVTPGITVTQLLAGSFTPAQAQIISQINCTTAVAVNYNCVTTITATGNFTDFVVVNQTVGAIGSDVYVDNICLTRDTCAFDCNNTNPVPSFTNTPTGYTANFTNTSTVTPGFMSLAYNWDFGDPASGPLNTSTMTNPSHTYPGPGIYTACLKVTAVDPNGNAVCNDSTCLDITLNPVGIAENAVLGVSMYPNPANDLVTITGAVPVTGIQLYNSVGQMMYAEKLQGNSFVIPAHLLVGVYSVLLTTPNGRAYKKLVISR